MQAPQAALACVKPSLATVWLSAAILAGQRAAAVMMFCLLTSGALSQRCECGCLDCPVVVQAKRTGTRSRSCGPDSMDLPTALETIVGARVGVWWEEDETYYKAGATSCQASDALLCINDHVQLLHTRALAASCTPDIEVPACCILTRLISRSCS